MRGASSTVGRLALGLQLVALSTALRLFSGGTSSTRLFASASAAAASSTPTTGAMASSCPTLADRQKGALMGLFYADAVASPVHWYYDRNALRRDYGVIKGYVKPKDKLEGSIMNLSNTGGGGRGSDQGSIIGDVINHGKKQYWVRGGNNHYHLGLEAGENTLEAQLTRLLTRTMVAKGAAFTLDDFRDAYIQFMRTPGSHNDTYASTAHRMFFANLVKGVAAKDCADNDGHNTDAIDALTLTVPIIVANAGTGMPKEELYRQAVACVAVTRRSRALTRYVHALCDLLTATLQGAPLRDTVESIGQEYFQGSVRNMVLGAGNEDPMVACYIDSSFPALLHFLYKYADSPEAAVLANANAGGENVARGSVLGAVMGAAHGMQGWPAWAREGLRSRAEVEAEAEALLARR